MVAGVAGIASAPIMAACAPAAVSPTAKPPEKPAAVATKPAEVAKPAEKPAETKPADATKPAEKPAGIAPSAAKPGALPKPGSMPAGSYMKQIQDRGKLVAGVKTDLLLFGYMNPRVNKIEGFDIDIVREIAKAIFGDPEKIELKEVTSASRIPSLKEGIVDVIAATMTITKDRLKEIDFSDVYYESAQMVLVPKASSIKGIADTASKKVCAAKGSTSEKNIAKFQPKAELVLTDKYSDCLLALQQGRVDAISTDDVILAGLAEQDAKMAIVGDRFTGEPYGIGMAKDKEGFRDFVNAVLSDLKASGKWKEIHKQWLGKYVTTPEPPTRNAVEAAV